MYCILLEISGACSKYTTWRSPCDSYCMMIELTLQVMEKEKQQFGPLHINCCVFLPMVQAQLVNFFQYRALIEGWNSMMWSKYTGVILWKTQNPWPGLRGQMYDHLLDQTGAFFGLQSAAEPVHVQLNLLTYDIEVLELALLKNKIFFNSNQHIKWP